MPVFLGTRTSSNLLPFSAQLPNHNEPIETLNSGCMVVVYRTAPSAQAFPND